MTRNGMTTSTMPLHVLITGESDGYYSDYVREPVRHFCRCLAEGFAYQGEYSEFHKGKRGEPTTLLPLLAFVSFLQNHDQIGNRAFGNRISQLSSAHALRAAMEILLRRGRERLVQDPPVMADPARLDEHAERRRRRQRRDLVAVGEDARRRGCEVTQVPKPGAVTGAKPAPVPRCAPRARSRPTS